MSLSAMHMARPCCLHSMRCTAVSMQNPIPEQLAPYLQCAINMQYTISMINCTDQQQARHHCMAAQQQACAIHPAHPCPKPSAVQPHTTTRLNTCVHFTLNEQLSSCVHCRIASRATASIAVQLQSTGSAVGADRANQLGTTVPAQPEHACMLAHSHTG